MMKIQIVSNGIPIGNFTGGGSPELAREDAVVALKYVRSGMIREVQE